jgi:peptidoglycan/xylan/chitin deacetylase (PgdA/CDA1 family)
MVALGGVLAGAFLTFFAPWLGLIVGLAGIGAALAILHRPGGVPILVYHSISPEAGWLPWAKNTSVRPDVFRRHLQTLKKGGWDVVSTIDFVNARKAGKQINSRTVILHFDDGYLDNYIFAAPILREFSMPATFFASLDFIEPGNEIRTACENLGPTAWTGYMTDLELRAMDADPLFDIEAHGVDHARVPVSDKPAEVLTNANWKRHAPLAWAYDKTNKSRWFEAETPPSPLQLGHPVPKTDSALAGRWWADGEIEAEPEYRLRVGEAMTRAHEGLGDVLGRDVMVFAWPFDRSCPVSVAAAKEAGFVAVTGGRGENRPDEDPTILSRVHVHDKAFGGGALWLEGLALRARVNAASGRLVWHILVVLAARLRARRYGRPGYEAVS